MDERKSDEFSLEDILQEFGVDPEPEKIQTADEDEDILIWGQEAAVPVKPVTSETIRLDQLPRAIREQQQSMEHTTRFTPVDEPEPEPEPVIPVPPQPEPEPFSETWEPEYEDPIRDYIPPEPIVFRPKSRLRELKRKLVEGPEKRYYELVEQGLGKLQLAIFLNLLVAAVSIGTAVMFSGGWLPEDRIRLGIFISFLTLLLSAMLGSYQLLDGLAQIFKLRFSVNSLLVFSLVACVVDGVLCLQSLQFPCSALFSLHMTCSLWSEMHRRDMEMGQMDTMRKAIRLDALVLTPDCMDGRPAFMRRDGQVEDFMDHYDRIGGPEKVLRIYALIALVVAAGIGIATGVLHGTQWGIQVFALSLLCATPAASFFCISRPMAILERKMHKMGTVLCGWRGVTGLCAKGIFALSDEDLFPLGSVKMNGVKYFGDRDPDQVVAYVAALIGECGGSLEPLFTRLLDIRSGYHYPVYNLHTYPGGVGAEINGEAVLAGGFTFMQNMGISLPAGKKVKHAVYVAIEGEVCGVYVMAYSKDRAAMGGAQTLCACNSVTPVLTALDFMLTEKFMKSRFGGGTRRMLRPEREQRLQLRSQKPSEDANALAITTRETFAGFAYAIAGARTLRASCRAGVAVSMIGGILGLVIMGVLGVLGAWELLSPVYLLIFEAIWLVPGLLITEWTRTV